ncbi:transcriptional co-activator mating type protein alpha [Lachancea thermotolerans CBS 6340]|uniref:KLTH0F00374p n=1 Tax=Lachancea thermotolerans (strain ATCC 56472 / CBS 6340 / NRRL Y-8284) TaxID=559295 RepID=C5DJY7_LACTC|nr:KLTH0F00374p [Lachancea thermotolerans CBS 6340]CAR23788.1 KLTH0F00374p [Lachancea thermotolerans CBS 6340]
MNSTKPSFKVLIKKKGKTLNRRLKNSSKSYRENGANLYMSYSKPQAIPKPPNTLINLVRSKKTSQSSRKCLKNDYILKELDVKKLSIYSNNTVLKKKINPFIGFRSYYAKFAKGRVRQQELSKILSEYWTKNSKIHSVWEFFTQHYNREVTSMCFTLWLEENYQQSYEESELDSECMAKRSQPYIEDLYSGTGEFLTKLTSRELLDISGNHSGFQGSLNSLPFFEEHNRTTDWMLSSILQCDQVPYYPN